MAQNRTKGGRQRGEGKVWEYFHCACCHKDDLTKRKSVYLGNDKDGNPIRVCKSHKVRANSPGVKTLVGA